MNEPEIDSPTVRLLKNQIEALETRLAHLEEKAAGWEIEEQASLDELFDRVRTLEGEL
jgi:hypothetical protein